MSFADWRAARRAERALHEIFGDAEANAAVAHHQPQQIELGSSSGPEGAYEWDDVNNQQQQQQQKQPVDSAPADQQQLPLQAEVVSAGPSSAPTVVGEASPKLASPVNEAAQLDAGGK